MRPLTRAVYLSRPPPLPNAKSSTPVSFHPSQPSDSYFAANGGKGGKHGAPSPVGGGGVANAQALGGTPDHLHASRNGGGAGMSAVGARFNPSPYKAKASGFFGGGESGPARFGAGGARASMAASSGAGVAVGGGGGGAAGGGFGQGMLGLSSLEEKEEEEAAVSPMNGGGWSVGGTAAGAGAGGAEGSRPASFERLRRQAEKS